MLSTPPPCTDYRENQPRWRLTARGTRLLVYLRAPTKAEAKTLAATLYGLPRWKARRVRG